MKPKIAKFGFLRRRAKNGPSKHGNFSVSKIFAKVRLIVLEAIYLPHLLVRYAHDHLYHKSHAYRKYSDHPATETAHRAALTGFLASFLIFTLLQYGVPNLFDFFRPQRVQAGSNPITWTSKSNFDGTSVPSGATSSTVTSSNIDLNAPQDSVKISTLSLFGTGADGPLQLDSANCTGGIYNIITDNVSGSKNSAAGKVIGRSTADGYSTTLSATAAPTATSITVANASGIAVNDEVLVIKLWKSGDTSTTRSDIRKVTNKATNTLTLASGLEAISKDSNGAVISGAVATTYPVGTLVQRIPQYTNVTINTGCKITTTAWNGTQGGIVAMRVSGSLIVNNSGTAIDASARGYLGATGPGAGNYGAFSYITARAGSGGGYGGAGGGSGPTVAGIAYQTFPDFGSGGGRSSSSGTVGGVGGGAVLVFANFVNNAGNISAMGGAGPLDTGGAAGGSIRLLYASTSTVGAGTVNGGAGGDSTNCGDPEGASYSYGGGGGGAGRIVIESALNPSTASYTASGGTGGQGGTWEVCGGNGGEGGQDVAPAYLYRALATFNTSGSLTSYKINTGAGSVSKWNNISWNTENLPANNTVVFQARSSADGTSGSWYTFTQTTGNTFSADLISAGVPANQWLEVSIQLTSDGYGSPQLNDFTVTYDFLEAPQLANLSISTVSNSTISTAGIEGVWTKDTQVSFNIPLATLTCDSCGTSENRRGQVEVVNTATAFNDSGVVGTNYIEDGGAKDLDGVVNGAILLGQQTVIANTAFAAGTSYHWRARAVDNQGRVSNWKNYGSGSDTPNAVADFSIDQTAPTLTSVSINVGAQYTNNQSVNLTLAGASDTGGSALSQMRFSNNGSTWSAWETYAATKSGWDMGTGDGTKTVYAQVRDNAGNISGQLTDTGFSGVTSNTVKQNGSIVLGPKSSTVYGDASDGHVYFDNFNGTSSVSVASTTTKASFPDIEQYVSYFKFSIPATPVTSASFFYNVVSSNVATGIICAIDDYGVLTSSEYPACVSATRSISLSSAAPQPKSVDVTDFVNSYISSSKSVIAFKMVTASGLATLNTYESGANKPYLALLSSPPYNTTGTYTSGVYDSTVTSNVRYGTFGVMESNTAGVTNIVYEVRGGEDNTPDDGTGNWTTYTTVASNATVPAGIQGKQFIQYRASLSTNDETISPRLSGITIDVSNKTGDSIILDTSAPTVPSNTITLPNGSETWNGNLNTYNITWNSAGINDGTGSGLITNPIKLEYTVDGTNWTQIATGEANDGTYTWSGLSAISPKLNSTTVKIRLTATDNVGLTSTDVSNNNFTIDSTAPTGSVDNLSTYYKTTAISVPYTVEDGAPGLLQSNVSGGASCWDDMVGSDVRNNSATQMSLTFSTSGSGITGSSSVAGVSIHMGDNPIPIASLGGGSSLESGTYALGPGNRAHFWCDDGGNDSGASVTGTVNFYNTQTISGVKNTKLYYTRQTTSPYTWTPYPNAGNPTAFTSSPATFDTAQIADATKSGNYGFKLVIEDNAGNVSAIPGTSTAPDKTTIIDMVAPTNTLSTTPSSPDGANGWFTTAPTIAMTRADTGGSGLATTVYRWDNADLTSGTSTYASPFVYSTPGTHTIYWKVTDNAGNVTLGNSVFKIDTTAPMAAITYNSYLTQTSANIALNRTQADATSGLMDYDIEYQEVSLNFGNPDFAGATWQEIGVDGGDNVDTFVGTNDKAYKFRYWVRNGAGVWGSGPADPGTASTYSTPAYWVGIDTSSPTKVSFSINNGDQATSDPALEIDLAFSFEDVGSGLASYQIDNNDGNWSSLVDITGSNGSFSGTYANWQLLPGEGQKTVRIKLRDIAGNEISNITDQIAYDITKPGDTTTAVYRASNEVELLPPNGYSQGWFPYSDPYVTFTADDDQSGVQKFRYCIIKASETCNYSDNADVTNITAVDSNTYKGGVTLSLADVRQGELSIKVRAYDYAGLDSTNETTYVYKFDKTLPGAVAEFDATKGDPTHPYSVMLTWDGQSASVTPRAKLEKYKIERIKASEYQLAPVYNSNWSADVRFVSYESIVCNTEGARDCYNLDNDMVGTVSYSGGRYTFEDTTMASSTKYIYRISAKDYSNAAYGDLPASDIELDRFYGFTKDTEPPVIQPMSVQAVACDGLSLFDSITNLTGKCSALNKKGSEIKVSWLPTTDSGSGIDYYEIWRNYETAANPDGWTLVKTYEEDEASNLDSSRRYAFDDTVDDARRYVYRIVAVDGATPGTPNKTPIAVGGLYSNFDNATPGAVLVPDVTPPTISVVNLAASPFGIDGLLNTEVEIPLSDGTGTATSGTTSILNDSGKSWQPGMLKGRVIKITAGANSGESRYILSNTATSVTTTVDWPVAINNTSVYEIYEGYQKITTSWKQSDDNTSNTNITYELYTSTSSNLSTFVLIDSKSSGSFDTAQDNSLRTEFAFAPTALADKTTYYFYLKVIDGDNNSATTSPLVQATTGNSQAPSPPTGVEVLNNDPGVTDAAHQLFVKYRGSKAKNCDEVTGTDCIVRYEAYQSVTNMMPDLDGGTPSSADNCTIGESADDCWIRINGATIEDIQVPNKPVADETLSAKKVFMAGGLAGTPEALEEATRYYFRVRAIDNNVDGALVGPLSAINTNAIHTGGWDITRDLTAPTLPAGGLEVKVKDTHKGENNLRRNLISWVLPDVPLRKKQTGEACTTVVQDGNEYCNDFDRYEIYRYVEDENNVQIPNTLVKAGEERNRAQNYFIDPILDTDILFRDGKIRYYVVIVDNSYESFLYPDGSKINAASNTTAPQLSGDTIIPSKATPSVVGNVTVSDVGVTSASVHWTTDQDTDSLIQYRPMKLVSEGADWTNPANWVVNNTNNDFVTVGQVNRTSTHDVRLFGMAPKTRYEYRLVSRNYLDNPATYNPNILANIITTGFDISYQSEKLEVTTASAQLYWTTNMPSNSSMIEFRESKGTQSGAVAETPVKAEEITNAMKDCGSNPSSRLCSHTVTISPLKKNTEYTINIVSVSLDNYSASSGLKYFTTANSDAGQFSIAPSASNVAERNITATSAQIVFQTTEPTNATLYYGFESGAPTYNTTDYKMSATDGIFGTTHVIPLTGLEPGRKYFYIAKVDNGLLSYSSPEASFTAVLKPKISNLRVTEVTPYSFKLAWETNVETETLINFGKTTAYGEKRGKQGMVKAHELEVIQLEDNQDYHYQILAKDETGQEVADDDKFIRTPMDTEGPKISGVKIDVLPMAENDNSSSVIISWQTNKPATTLVEYGEGVIGGTYDKRSVEDTTLNNSHTVIVKGLTPASSYHYRLVSADKRGNKTISQDYTFVTPSKEKSILQLILKSLEETFAWTRNLNQFFGNIGKRISGN